MKKLLLIFTLLFSIYTSPTYAQNDIHYFITTEGEEMCGSLDDGNFGPCSEIGIDIENSFGMEADKLAEDDFINVRIEDKSYCISNGEQVAFVKCVKKKIEDKKELSSTEDSLKDGQLQDENEDKFEEEVIEKEKENEINNKQNLNESGDIEEEDIDNTNEENLNTGDTGIDSEIPTDNGNEDNTQEKESVSTNGEGLLSFFDMLGKIFWVLSIISLISFVFWLIMMIHAIQNPIKNKVVWILVLIFIPFGFVIYYFAVKRNYKKISEQK